MYIIRIQYTWYVLTNKMQWLSGAQDQQTEHKARDSPLPYIILLIIMRIRAVYSVSLGFLN
jgi:hypothetical protein